MKRREYKGELRGGSKGDTAAVRTDSEAVGTSGLVSISCRQRYDASPNDIE